MANDNSRALTGLEVLRRYKDEGLPLFFSVELEHVNQLGLSGERPLNTAATRGIMEEIVALVGDGADVNAPGELGHTPLHDAVVQGHIQAVRFLLCHGASVKSRNEFGDTPLDMARKARRNDIAELLEASDVSSDVPEGSGSDADA